MERKNCVITGGNSGIGFETALALSRSGANVIIVCRNPEKAEDAVQAIQERSGNPHVGFVVGDLGSQESIRGIAREILRQFRTIDVLVNNAGAWFSKLDLTEDGIERQFAINHLAYFLLTHELLTALHASSDGRIICVGSDSHFHGKLHFDDFSLRANYHGLRAYAQTKLANIMFVYELDRRLKNRGINNISVNCVQPGLVKTDIGLKHTISFHALAWKIRRMGGVGPEKGAKTSVYLATSEEVKGQSGKYWDKCMPKSSARQSYVQEDAHRLWEASEALCGIEEYFKGIPQV